MQVLIDGIKVYRDNSNGISQQFNLSQGAHVITVQSKASSGLWMEAAVKISVGAPLPPISVSISPKSSNLVPSGIQQFSAAVTGQHKRPSHGRSPVEAEQFRL
jgi:hypothetical protein